MGSFYLQCTYISLSNSNFSCTILFFFDFRLAYLLIISLLVLLENYQQQEWHMYGYSVKFQDIFTKSIASKNMHSVEHCWIYGYICHNKVGVLSIIMLSMLECYNDQWLVDVWYKWAWKVEYWNIIFVQI